MFGYCRQHRRLLRSPQLLRRRLSGQRCTPDQEHEHSVLGRDADHAGAVRGIVHDRSASGQTVFVEPLETIEQNNELVRVMEEELAEIHRILAEMTRRVAEQGGVGARAE